MCRGEEVIELEVPHVSGDSGSAVGVGSGSTAIFTRSNSFNATAADDSTIQDNTEVHLKVRCAMGWHLLPCTLVFPGWMDTLP